MKSTIAGAIERTKLPSVAQLVSESHFKIVVGRDRLFEITVPGRLYSAKLKRYFDLYVGYRFNLASVYRVPGGAFLYANRANEASLWHDFLCDHLVELGITRAQADAVFLEVATITGKPWWVRYPMYYSTRVGAGWHWLKSLAVDDEDQRKESR